MTNIKTVIIRRLLLFFVNLCVCFFFIISYLNKNLKGTFLTYGEYQCKNIYYNILNEVVKEEIKVIPIEKAVTKNIGEVITIDYNVEMFNSFTFNVINKFQKMMYVIENDFLNDDLLRKIGVEDRLSYDVPMSMIFDNFLISNLGESIPIKYRMIGELKGEVISTIQEYGINNALLEVKVQITGKSKMLIPLETKEVEVSIGVPVVVQVIQGSVPGYYFGSHSIGGIK